MVKKIIILQTIELIYEKNLKYFIVSKTIGRKIGFAIYSNFFITLINLSIGVLETQIYHNNDF